MLGMQLFVYSGLVEHRATGGSLVYQPVLIHMASHTDALSRPSASGVDTQWHPEPGLSSNYSVNPSLLDGQKIKH